MGGNGPPWVPLGPLGPYVPGFRAASGTVGPPGAPWAQARLLGGQAQMENSRKKQKVLFLLERVALANFQALLLVWEPGRFLFEKWTLVAKLGC